MDLEAARQELEQLKTVAAAERNAARQARHLNFPRWPEPSLQTVYRNDPNSRLAIPTFYV